MLDLVVASILSDPTKAIFGSGGVLGAAWILLRWWHARPRTKIRFLEETFDVGAAPTMVVRVKIEVENVGTETTSLGPHAFLSCRTLGRKQLRQQFSVVEPDRTLPAATPKVLHLAATVSAAYVNSHFRIFKFTSSRGTVQAVRILNASGESTGMVKFVLLEVLYVLFGALPHVKG